LFFVFFLKSDCTKRFMKKEKPSVALRGCNHITWETEFKASLGYTARPHQKKRKEKEPGASGSRL
jgi:hypothetical protein